jgi:hypothetical protein
MIPLRTFWLTTREISINVLIPPYSRQIHRRYQLGQSTKVVGASKTVLIPYSPLNKTQLATGEWSIIILSNNGNGDPIAYQRDFSLTVGPQSTATVTPTITANLTSTPIVSNPRK